jgi:signal transduction histidine kinase
MEAAPSPLRLASGAVTTWIHRAIHEGGVPVGRIAAEVDVTALATERRATLLALVGVNAALTLLFAVLGWLLVRRMLTPVLRLSERLGRAAEGRLDPIPEAELPPPDTEAGRAFRRYNAAAAAIAEREALLTRLAEQERRALVGRYASAMAHEVNNPLGGLFNAVRMIQRHGDDPERRLRAASLLERGLTGIHNIVRASLILWRGEADARPVSAADIEDLRLLIESEARRRELILDWRQDIEGSFPAPAQAVRQITLNLLLNACAVSPPGGRVTVRASAEGGLLTLVVADEGPGLPAEARKLLLDGRAEALPQAGGLGLWTIARLVRELGARVQLAGPPGTHVTIRIPDAECRANLPAAA